LLACARVLIDHGADVEARDSDVRGGHGCTPLHYCMFTPYPGQAAMVRLLAEAGGADVNAVTSQGYSPLHYAADAAAHGIDDGDGGGGDGGGDDGDETAVCMRLLCDSGAGTCARACACVRVREFCLCVRVRA
jgi:hypothetical protein